MPAVRALFAQEIEAFSTEFRGYERIRAFALLPESFSTDNGMLTPTLKVRRREVVERYRARLDALYAAGPAAERSAAAHA